MIASQTMASLAQGLALSTEVGWIALSSLVLAASTLGLRRSRHNRQRWADRSQGLAWPAGVWEQGSRVAPLQHYRLCRLRGRDQQQYLALRVGQDYYTFYRQRSSLQQATCLVAQWQRRGYAALATHDAAPEKSTYAVWVRGLYLPSVFHPS